LEFLDNATLLSVEYAVAYTSAIFPFTKRRKNSILDHPVVLLPMTRREGELLTFQRVGYILLSLDSRWKIAVPRLGPAIIATRCPHLPGVAAAAASTTPVLFLILSVALPSSPVAPLGIRRPRSRQPPPFPPPIHPARGDPCSLLLPGERSRGFYLCPLRSIRRTE